MEININLQPISEFLALPTLEMAWRLFITIGWIPLVVGFLWGAKELWIYYRQNYVYGPTLKSLFLAIDVPKGNEQSPRAVENILTYFLGAHATLNLIETYWEGKFQLSFSLEIVSIDGYTQFIIKTPVAFKDLVESAIYSQYPDAEITQIDDYTKDMPSKFPDEEYDMWGCDFTQPKHWVYPIKCYEEFEHSLGKEGVQFKDPMATLMDLCSTLIKGEQLWFQIILRPEGFDWMGAGDKEILKILGEKPKASAANAFVDKIIEEVGNFSEFIYSLWGNIEDKKKEEKPELLKMMNLKPKEKKQVEAIQRKVSKLGFTTKMRFIYIAKKEVFNKPKVVNGFIGFLKQFSDLDLNNIKPDMDFTATSTSYMSKGKRVNARKRRLMKNYKGRDWYAGRAGYIMNVEELATVWHFPLESAVKAPLIQKTPGRKAEAPMTLPIGEELVSEEILEPLFEEEKTAKPHRPAATSSSVAVFDNNDSGEEDYWTMDIANEGKPKDTAKKEVPVDRDGTKGAPPPNLPFA